MWAARSARTGVRVMSFSDTTRSSAIASFTAVSDVPPRSKKSSRRPIRRPARRGPGAHAAASALARSAWPARRASPSSAARARRPAPSAPWCRSCRSAVSGSGPAGGTPPAPCSSGSVAAEPVGAARRPRSARRRRRSATRCVLPSARSATTTAPSRTPGTRSRAFSISPISIRKPRILTWCRGGRGTPACRRAASGRGRRAVEALAGPVRVGQVTPAAVRSGSLTYPRPTHTPENTISPGGAQRDRLQVGVDDVDPRRCGPAGRAASGRRPGAVRMHLVVGVVGGLGQPVGVDQRTRAGRRTSAPRARPSAPRRWPTPCAGPAAPAAAAPGRTARPPGRTGTTCSTLTRASATGRRTAGRRGSRPARRAAVRPPTSSADTSCHSEMSKHCGAVWATTCALGRCPGPRSWRGGG